MHMLSCYQTTLLLYMASTICTLIDLICVNPLYLKFGFRLRTKTFGLLLPTFQERRTMMQIENHTKKQTELEWMLNQKILIKIISKFQFQPELDLFAPRLSRLTKCLSHTILRQRLCILMLFQFHGRVDPSVHFLPLL